MAVGTNIYEPRDPVGRSLSVSIALHVFLVLVALFLPTILGLKRGDNWGGATAGGGDAMSATLVSNIPLPANPDAKNVLANESKGLTESQPVPKAKEDEKAIPIPDQDAKKKKDKADRVAEQSTKTQPKNKPAPAVPSREKPREEAKLDNNVPFGAGGPVSGPYGSFSAPGAKGGFGFTGGGGDFGSRYSWYVDQVRRKVSENWMKYEIDPRVSTARRVYIQFDIVRAGSPQNIRIEQSSGVPSLDQSAMRALQRIDTFGPLPGDYSGSKVSVEFWFDYKR